MTKTHDMPTILSFRQSLRACTKCELSANCTGPVPWNGDLNPELAILGEAPGKVKDREGKPFMGPAGYMMRLWLKEAGWDPARVTFLNAVSCWPRTDRTPTAAHMAACRPWMHGQLEIIRPKILLTVGVTALTQLTGRKWPKLINVHGKPMRHPVYNFPVFSSYHPASVINSKGPRGGKLGNSKKYEQIIREDLKALREWDGCALEVCYICGEELYRFDEWGLGMCERHSARQGILWPEDQGVTSR